MKALTLAQANAVNRMLQSSLDVSRGLQSQATTELETLREWLENELPAPHGAFQTYEERLGLLKYWLADLEATVQSLKSPDALEEERRDLYRAINAKHYPDRGSAP